MNEHRRADQPLPLDEVLGIVERRRRRRARTRAVAAPALSVASVAAAGAIVAALQAGGDGPPALTPAAPPPAASAPASAPPSAPPSAPVSASESAPESALPSAPPVPSSTAAPAIGGPPIDPGWLDPGLLPGLASTIAPEYRADGDAQRLAADAEELARVWDVEASAGAGAIVVKADLNGEPIDPADPAAGDALVDRFTGAGYTGADAEQLARVWGTDARTAAVMAGLLVELDLLDG